MAKTSNEFIEKVATMSEPCLSMAEKAAVVDLKNADLALQVLYDIDVSPEEVAVVDEKAFLGKVDYHMLPIVSVHLINITLPRQDFSNM